MLHDRRQEIVTVQRIRAVFLLLLLFIFFGGGGGRGLMRFIVVCKHTTP